MLRDWLVFDQSAFIFSLKGDYEPLIDRINMRFLETQWR